MQTLLNWSGGLDSTLVLYNFLSGNPKATLLVHHTRLSNFQGRADHEQRAIESIRAQLQEDGLTNYRYIETGIDYGDLTHRIRDHEVVAFWSGVILRDPRYRGIRTILVPFIDVDGHTPNRENLWMSVLKTVAHPVTPFASGNPRYSARENVRRVQLPKLEYPIVHMTKGQIINALPERYRRLTWWCRVPRGPEQRPCGRCWSCGHVRPHYPEAFEE